MMDDPGQDALREIAERYRRDMAEMVQGLQPSLAELVKDVSGSGDEEVRRVAREWDQMDSEFRERMQNSTTELLAQIRREVAAQVAQSLPPRQDPDGARHKKLVEDVLTIRALLSLAEHKLEELGRELGNGHAGGGPLQGYRPTH